MTKPTIKVINTQTGEAIEREMDAIEFAQYQKDQENWLAKKAEQEKIQSDKLAAVTKLEALGLTPNDLKALGL